jgi:hypothetical protein
MSWRGQRKRFRWDVSDGGADRILIVCSAAGYPELASARSTISRIYAMHQQHDDLIVAATGEYLGRRRRNASDGGEYLVRRDGSIGLIVRHKSTGRLYAFDQQLDLQWIEDVCPDADGGASS